MNSEISEDGLARHLLGLDPARRVICALAGAPGSGKSTLADALVARLNADAPGTAEVLPMDGFHYDDLYLVPAGLRARKGAPDTFDIGGLRSTLDRLRTNTEDRVAVPVFDREIEIARAGARMIDRSVRVLVVEGNYLLLDAPPWRDLRACFDVSVMIDVPEAVLRDRLVARWQGYHLTPSEISAKLEDNDLPNGRHVRSHSSPTDFVIRQQA